MAFKQESLDDYIDVAERIADFRQRYPEGTLQPHEPWKLLQAQGFEKNGDAVTQTFIVYIAAAYRHPADPRPGIGAAWEIFPGRTPYTRGSELMNAETSAWGRAIIAVGASDSKRGITSREEVRNRQAEREQDEPRYRSAYADPEHQRLVHGSDERIVDQGRAIRRKGPDDESRSWEGPPGDLAAPTAPEDSPGTASNQQKFEIVREFERLGIAGRSERLAETCRQIGRQIESSRQLSMTEAAKVIKNLEAVPTPDTAGKADSDG